MALLIMKIMPDQCRAGGVPLTNFVFSSVLIQLLVGNIQQSILCVLYQNGWKKVPYNSANNHRVTEQEILEIQQCVSALNFWFFNVRNGM